MMFSRYDVCLYPLRHAALTVGRLFFQVGYFHDKDRTDVRGAMEISIITALEDCLLVSLIAPYFYFVLRFVDVVRTVADHRHTRVSLEYSPRRAFTQIQVHTMGPVELGTRGNVLLILLEITCILQATILLPFVRKVCKSLLVFVEVKTCKSLPAVCGGEDV